MTYKDYFELTSALVKQLHGLKQVDDTANCIQYELDDTYLSIIKLPSKHVVLVVYLGERVQSIIVGESTLPVKFPTELTADIIANFDFMLKQLMVPQKVQGERNQVNDTENKPQPDVQLKSGSSVSSKPNDMPDFDDELEINAKPKVASRGYPSIGDADLNPPGLPKHPEMKQWHDPLQTLSGGMYPSPGMFGDPNQGNTSRLGVPPGARFDDPYGEDSLQDIGQGLPSGLRRGGAPGAPGFGQGSFGGFGPGGSSGFGGGFM